MKYISKQQRIKKITTFSVKDAEPQLDNFFNKLLKMNSVFAFNIFMSIKILQNYE